MANKGVSVRESPPARGDNSADRTREVPIQVMVPEAVRRQVALMGADRGENIRTLVLRGLKAIGIDVPDSELGDRRGRRRNRGEATDGAE
jgi:hypothetical protein